MKSIASERLLTSTRTRPRFCAPKMAALEKMIGAASMDWEPTHGREYFVPPRAGASILQVEAAKKVLSLEAGGMLSADVSSDLAKMHDWLEAVPEAERGATWATVRAQYTKLSLHDIRWGVHDAIAGQLGQSVAGPHHRPAALHRHPVSQVGRKAH